VSDGLLGFPVKYLQLRLPGARVMTRRNLRGLLPALLIAGSTTGYASGQQDFVNYPTGVRRALVAADESCRRAGGTRVTLTVNAVRRLDLNGDGRDDYIVDFHETECGGRASFFCGTGGCDLLILVAQRGGALRKIFDDRVRGYEILSGRGPAKSASYSMVHIAAVTAIHHAKKRDASRQSRSNSNNQTSEDNSAAVLLCLADSGGSA
jgi:hypothetical protein